jgi:hypothetical protein
LVLSMMLLYNTKRLNHSCLEVKLIGKGLSIFPVFICKGPGFIDNLWVFQFDTGFVYTNQFTSVNIDSRETGNLFTKKSKKTLFFDLFNCLSNDFSFFKYFHF